MKVRARYSALVAGALLAGMVPVLATTAALAGQPVPGHTHLVPQVPRTDQPKISDGEIFDIAAIGNVVYVVGSFTSYTKGTTTIQTNGLAAWNSDTGALLPGFKPVVAGGAVTTVETTPDGTKLFIGGSFKTVNGLAVSKVAELNPTTGAPISTFHFTGTTNNQVTALATTNSTLYVGGKFTKINGSNESGLAAVSTATGAVDTTFTMPLSGGIGVNGELTVQVLKLTHDESKLIVIHTGRQIAGQDRLGIGIIATATKTLLPWRTELWDNNLARVGGVTRVYAGDVSPDDSYFVVTAGSGGDAPPISDVAVKFPVAGADNVQPIWVSRHFDSVYSVAITEDAIYLGGHFQWQPSPTAPTPWPGLTNVGYGTGQGISAYALGDEVVRVDHLGALDPNTGDGLEWDPGSNSFQGNKAMLATSRGLFAGGDATIQGGKSGGRIAFFDFNNDPNAPTATDTTITTPIEGRVEASGVPFTITGTAIAPSGVSKVQVEIQDRNSKLWLQPDGVTWAAKETNVLAALASPGATSTTYSLPMTLTGTAQLQVLAKTVGKTASDLTKAVKKIEVFDLTDQTPATNITGPPSGLVPSTSFTMTGTATDDHGVNRISIWFRDENSLYLQDDGTVSAAFNTFTIAPDVINSPNATYSYDVTLPHEGTWRGSATAIDNAGQADLRSATRDWIVSTTDVAPSVTISSPITSVPPIVSPTVVVAPGGKMTFAGTASDDTALAQVLITLRNTTTRENLAADGTWGVNAVAGSYRVSPINIGAPTYNWSYTTPFNLTPGSYTFTVRAIDNLGLSTASANTGRLTVTAEVPGDAFPDTALTFTGTDQTPQTLNLNLTGTATDDHGVASVQVALFNSDTGQYVQTNGTLAATFATVPANLGTPGGTSTTFALPITLPAAGTYNVTAWARDTAGQQDPSTIGATAKYLVYPGDANPTFDPTLGAPVSNTTFTQGVIVVSGRANDDISIAQVQVAVINNLGQYMSSTGTFTSTLPSWRTAFLNSPGSSGSNFAYTTPVIPAGTYTVSEQGIDNHGKIGLPNTVTSIVVTKPANLPPVAHATVTCVQNVCTFDGRTSTDEDTTTLGYAWSFGDGTTGVGSVPVKTFTAAATYTVTLTVTDYWGATGTTTFPVTIAVPPGNVAPVPTFITSCLALACGTSSTGTVDPNVGDVITYAWNWGDGSLPGTGSAPSHTYATPGTYTVTMTATDGWGKAASIAKVLSLVEPVTNVPPVPAFSSSCLGLLCLLNGSATVDPNGDQISYSWSFGDGTAPVTGASPSHTYLIPGTYTITLTATDGWNRSASTSSTVTVP